MIPVGRALVERIDDRRAELREEIAAASAELERLDELVAPLRAWMNQPERALEDGHAVSTDTPAPAPRSEPPGSPLSGRSPAITQPPAGRADAEQRGGAAAPVPGSADPPAVSHAFGCSCGRSFATQRGRSRHQAADRTHTDAKPNGIHATTRETVEATGHIPPAPIGEVKNGHPSARETFLCGRCDRSFPSREALTQHETQVDCQRVPTRPPLERAPFVLPGSPVGQIAGLGE